MTRSENSNACRLVLWRSVALASVFVLAFVVRSLYAVSLAPSMYTTAQPGTRMSVRYHSTALDILRGEGVLWPRQPDPARTGVMARPPGYSLFLAGVYAVSAPSFFRVQLLQNVLGSLACVAVVLSGALLVSWPVGVLAGVLAALSPHLGLVTGYVTADALCGVALALALLCLATGYGRPGRRWLLLAGTLVGAGVWLRPNVLLLAPAVGCVLVASSRERRAALRDAALLCVATACCVLPITLRNYVVFEEFVPVSINGGMSFWHGVADAGGAAYGAHPGDKAVMEEEAVRYGNPRYREWWAEPDGVFRDRERFRRARQVIAAHPWSYARAVGRRAAAMLHFATPEVPVVSGPVAVTLELAETGNARALPGFERTAAEERYLAIGRWAEPLRQPLGWLQSAVVLALLPLLLVGTLALVWWDWRRAALLLAIPVYYLCTEPLFFYEWRVATPMHFPVVLVAAAGLVLPIRALHRRARRLPGSSA